MPDANLPEATGAAAPTPDFCAITSGAARDALEAMLGAFGDDRRWDGYSVAEDAVRRAVLRCYVADGWAPDTMRLAGEAALTVDEVRGHLARLRARDRVVLDGDGEAILGAYPFTERATGHRVRLGGIVLNAMCAIDALGVGAGSCPRTWCRSCG